MSKYLFIVTELQSANGICTRAIMDELTKRGHGVLCLTNDIPGKGKSFFDNGITFYTVRPRWLFLLNQYILLQKDNTYKKNLLYIFLFLNKIKLFLSFFTWPLISPLYTLRYFTKAINICRYQTIDHIVPIYTQVDAVVAAFLVKKMLPNIRYSPYMLDALSAGYGPKLLSKTWIEKRGRKWEQILFSNADQVLFMKSSEQYYRSMDEAKHLFTYVDLPLVKENNTHERFDFFDQKNINIVYTGTIPHQIRNPKYIIDLFLSLNIDNIRLFFIGTIDNKYLFSMASKCSKLISIPFLPHEECVKAINCADFLLNLGNSQPYMMPSKLFEYFSTGKPIISTYSIDSDPTLDYITRYPHSIMLKERDELMEADIDKLKQFLMKFVGKNISFEIIKEIFIENTPEYTADIIESISQGIE